VARQRAGTSVVLLTTLSLVAAGVPATRAGAATSIGSDQQSVTQLEHEIAAEGAKAQSLVLQSNEAQARLDALNAQIAQDEKLLSKDQQAQARATSAMQNLAIQAYMSKGGSDATFAMFSGKWNVSRLLEQDTYTGSVNNKLNGVVSTLRAAESDTQAAQDQLRSEQSQAKKGLDELTAAHDAATQAIASEEAQLSHVKGNLRTLVAAAFAQQQDEERAAERRLAAPAVTSAPDPAPIVSRTTPTTSAPDPPPASPQPPPSSAPPPPINSSSGYANPFRAVSGLVPERIDQGVDYAGFGPVYAIGDATVVWTVGNGWPGGTFIAYQFTDGPARGLVAYLAEDVEPSVQVGQTVSSGTVIGQMYEGPNGIETGWANPAALPDTMARTFGQFNGSNSSAFGVNFSQFLQSLGAPGGIQNSAPSGVLPAGWPQW
jgi:murein DD-endopeptidase MepM/ murein hydrolase activator NlpD